MIVTSKQFRDLTLKRNIQLILDMQDDDDELYEILQPPSKISIPNIFSLISNLHLFRLRRSGRGAILLYHKVSTAVPYIQKEYGESSQWNHHHILGAVMYVYFFSRHSANAELVFGTVSLIQNRCLYHVFMMFLFSILYKTVAEKTRRRGKTKGFYFLKNIFCFPSITQRRKIYENRGTKNTDL